MSTISASTTTTTAYKVTADTTGALVLQSGSGPTTAVTIDTSQNVGIGTSSPSQKLEVAGTIKSTSSTGALLQNSTATGSNALRIINNSGSVYIGTENSAGTDYSLPAYAPFIYANYSTPICFVSNGTERARIDSSGNLLVGTTNTTPAQSNVTGFKVGGGQIECNGISTQAALFGRSDNGQVIRFYSAGSAAGNITNTGTVTTYNGTSDYRLKENIQPMVNALEKVISLKPCTYVWKDDGRSDNGFIAHELQEVLPNAVTGEKDAVDADGNPEYQGIDPRMIVATLTAAIQEQQALISTLTERISALEAK